MDKNKHPPPAKSDTADSSKHKGVGDETPNPLPTRPIAVEQPADDANPANPDTESAID